MCHVIPYFARGVPSSVMHGLPTFLSHAHISSTSTTPTRTLELFSILLTSLNIQDLPSLGFDMDLFDLDNAHNPDDWWFSAFTEFRQDESANNPSLCDSGPSSIPPNIDGQYRMMDLPPYDSSLFDLSIFGNPTAQDISNGFVDDLSQVPSLEDKQNSASVSSDSEPPFGLAQPPVQSDTCVPGIQGVRGVLPNAPSVSPLIDWNHDRSPLRQGERANSIAMVETKLGADGGGSGIDCADLA